MCGFLFVKNLFHNFFNVICAQAKFLQQVHSRTGMAEHIVDTDAGYRHGALFAHNGADSFAQTADLFLGEYKGGLIDQIAIDKY